MSGEGEAKPEGSEPITIRVRDQVRQMTAIRIQNNQVSCCTSLPGRTDCWWTILFWGLVYLLGKALIQYGYLLLPFLIEKCAPPFDVV